MRKRGRKDPARNGRRKGAGIALGLAGALAPQAADAATFTVTNLNDAGAGSLRQAVGDANGAAGADTITFQAGLTGTIVLTTGQLPLTDSVAIQGPGAAVLSVSGNDASRVFYLYNAASTLNVTISGLTITHGNGMIGGGIVDFDENLTLDGVVLTGNQVSSDGGGLWADGFNMNLTIKSSTISGNAAGGGGGGIYVEDTGGPLLIQDTVISNNNAAGSGGGIYFYDPDAAVTIKGCTISGNVAGTRGGGIYMYDTDGTGAVLIDSTTISGNSANQGGGAFFYGPDTPLVIENCTISGNQATAGTGGGVGFYSTYFGVQIRHTTIAANSASGEGGGIWTLGNVGVRHSILADNTAASNPDAATGAASLALAYSLLETPGTANVVDGGGNVLNTDPQLGPLANNGGTTLTMAPATSSPVRDTGDPAFVAPPSTDQRGQPRVFNGRVDMGSVELQIVPVELQKLDID